MFPQENYIIAVADLTVSNYISIEQIGSYINSWIYNFLSVGSLGQQLPHDGSPTKISVL